MSKSGSDSHANIGSDIAECHSRRVVQDLSFRDSDVNEYGKIVSSVSLGHVATNTKDGRPVIVITS